MDLGLVLGSLSPVGNNDSGVSPVLTHLASGPSEDSMCAKQARCGFGDMSENPPLTLFPRLHRKSGLISSCLPAHAIVHGQPAAMYCAILMFEEESGYYTIWYNHAR